MSLGSLLSIVRVENSRAPRITRGKIPMVQGNGLSAQPRQKPLTKNRQRTSRDKCVHKNRVSPDTNRGPVATGVPDQDARNPFKPNAGAARIRQCVQRHQIQSLSTAASSCSAPAFVPPPGYASTRCVIPRTAERRSTFIGIPSCHYPHLLVLQFL